MLPKVLKVETPYAGRAFEVRVEEVEIRPVFEAEDFGANLTPELREQGRKLGEQLSRSKQQP